MVTRKKLPHAYASVCAHICDKDGLSNLRRGLNQLWPHAKREGRWEVRGRRNVWEKCAQNGQSEMVDVCLVSGTTKNVTKSTGKESMKGQRKTL
jgi:hypothetical protein